MSFINGKKSVFKDIENINKGFLEGSDDLQSKKGKGGRTRKEGAKRDKKHTFYCTQEELRELEEIAREKHLSISEYIRIKVFS